MDGRLGRPLAAAASVPPHVSAAAPHPPHVASSMAINQYRDFLSQASVSSYAASGSSTYPSFFDVDEFGLSSQAPSSPFTSNSQSAPHMRMETLDLNSQVGSFPHLDMFPNQEQLQADGGRGGHGLPPLRPAGRGSLSQVNPPCQSGARSQSRGRCSGQPSRSVTQGLPLGGIGGGGRRGRVPIRVDHGSTSVSTAEDEEHAYDNEEGDDNDFDPRFQSKDFDTAHWSDQNIYYFCELFIEQMRKGNWNNGTMTSRGYIEIRKKYYHITSLWHDTKCMKNRVKNCKTMYLFWLKLNKDTGLGRKSDGTIDATPEWWKENTKGQAECRKFQKGNPDFLPLLIEMFQGVAVDGSSSCIPGQQAYDVEGYDAGGVSRAAARSPAGSDADVFENSPMSISSRKRASSSATTAESPSKKRKAPLLNMIRELRDKFDEDSKLSNEKLEQYRNSKALRQMKKKQDKQEHIDRCLDMAKECGASEETEEFFMATKLFEKEYNRNIFCKLSTSESRFLWLRRWCQSSSG